MEKELPGPLVYSTKEVIDQIKHLDEMNQKKLLHDGDKIIIAGFGGGLTWGADVITWRKK